ncbi:hypothetical protein JIR001_09160 [Polycladomyces abyssicola]|uniref:Iron-binding zinc finger CDGSH type domain-containing protein n=1 Tax=Polycladomyces abyssicola TaxID=1125966 RepID=A0A8D5UEB5_9BACL|nr:hypothetical protein JIR001_09160 [Polycladomyces abyssicola]
MKEAQSIADVTIKVNDQGPLVVSGPVELIDALGNRFETRKVFALCRCGLSQNKPFCDGNHAGNFDCARAKQAE